MFKTDDSTFDVDFNELGWVGVERDTEEVRAMREYLAEHNGIRNLETCTPDEPEREVVIKIIRPGIEKTIRADLRVMYFIARTM